MTRTLTISDTGLRLIKAFEGFRPDDKTLVTGIRVVGYGHRLEADDEPVHMSRMEAEEQLLEDLEPVEILINDEVHAPLTQGQYDALCSLGFNIGLDALRSSDVVRALNNGRILDAANGFDVWRKASVNGDVYVVDALMRRRTAEKSLFLRNDPAVPAPTAMLTPLKDPFAPVGPTDDGLPRVNESPDAGIIEDANLVAQDVEGSAFDSEFDETVDAFIPASSLSETVFDDNPANFTVETETESEAAQSNDIDDDALKQAVEVLDEDLDMASDFDPNVILNATEQSADADTTSEADIVVEEEQRAPSSIAEAADSLGDRLTALLDTDEVEEAEVLAEAIPSSLVDPEDNTPRSNLVSFPKRELVLTEEMEAASDDELTVEIQSPQASDEELVLIDSLAEDDVIRASRDPESQVFDPEGDPVENAMLYLERRASEQQPKAKTGGGFWIPLVLGSTLLGASGVLMGRGATELLSNWGPSAVIAAAITGGLMLLFAFYALMRGRFA
ncbi:MAG: lysozyme [Pseudomonadota bacterium]